MKTPEDEEGRREQGESKERRRREGGEGEGCREGLV